MIIMNNDNKIKNFENVEIVSNISAVGCLKKTDFSNNLIVCFSLELSYGHLKSLQDYDRSCLKELYPHLDISIFKFQEEMNQLKEYVEKAEKIRIWSSHLDANEFLLLCYICYLFPSKNISVIFSEEYNWYCYSIGCMHFEEVNELVKREHHLSQNEINDYITKWNKVLKENKPLRYLVNGEIKSVSLDYFNQIILTSLKQLGEVDIYRLIAYLMGNFVINNSSDALYKYLIHRLINKNKIVITKVENGKEVIKINEVMIR